MSGTELRTSQQGADGTVDSKGKRSYTAHYQVKMSRPADGPAEVIIFLGQRNIYFGVPYSYNGDQDLSAFCNGLSPRRKPGSIEWWDVTVTYGPPEESDPQDENGYPSDEPNDWRWQCSMGYSTWQVALEKAYNLTVFPQQWPIGANCPYERALLTLGPVVNSANVPYDPGLMADVFDRVFQITTFSRTYDGSVADNYMGAINHDTISYHSHLTKHYKLVADSFAKYEVKCTNATATARTFIRGDQRIPYWEWNWEFRFRNRTWIEELLDRGLTGRPEDGVAGGNPGYAGDEVDAGRSPLVPVLDMAERRVPEMVLFNGAGQPMLPSDPKWKEGYYFSWLKDTLANFTYPNIPFKFFS